MPKQKSQNLSRPTASAIYPPAHQTRASNHLACSLGLAAGLLLPVVSATAVAAGKMETIIVTASRTPLALSDTASAVSIFSAAEIQQRNASSIAELLREIPGFALSQQGSKGAVTQLRVRGAEANQVLVLIDGIEVNDVAQGSEFNFAHLLTSQIQRIEVIRGPQSALWGSDALAGAINVQTLADTPGQSAGQAQANMEIGSFNSRAYGTSLLTAGENYQLGLGLSDYSTDGTNISRQGGEADGYANTSVNLHGRYTTAADLQLGFSYRYTGATTAYDDIDYVVTGLPVDADFRTESRQAYSRVFARYGLFDDLLHQTLSLARADTDNVNLAGQITPDSSRGLRDKITLQTDLTMGAQTVTVLLEHEREDYGQRGTATFFGDPNKDLASRTNALAAEYRLNADSFDLSLSARQENNSEFDNAMSWRTTAAWHSGRHTTWFASLGKAVKNPTFTERFGFFDTFLGNPDLQPEQSRGWELGVRQQLLQADLDLSASWFHSTLQNEINGFVYAADIGAFTAANSNDVSRRQGLELEAHWTVSNNLALRGSYTYLDAIEVASNGSDKDEVRRPRHTLSLNGNYAWDRSQLNMTLLYTGRQSDDFFPPFPPYQARVNLDAYTLLHVAASHKLSDQLQLSLGLDNLLAENYEEVYGFQAPGRSARLGLRYAF